MPRPTGFLLIALCLLFGMTGQAFAATPGEASKETWLDVRLEGLDASTRKRVLEALTIARRAHDPDSAAAPAARRLHSLALEQIKLVLESRGYYRATVSGDLQADGEHWRALYRVVPGERVPVTSLAVRVSGAGSDDELLQSARREFPLHAGDPLDQDAYEQGKSSLLRTARARGYLESRFTVHVVTVDLAAYRATVELELATGPRYRFGAVRYRQDVFDERFLERFAPFRSGDYYDTALTGRLQRRLSDSGLFGEIRVEAHTDAPEGLDVPMDVVLVPRKRNRYSTAIGYGTDRGAWLRFNYLRRWVNPMGHSLRADLEWAERKALAQVSYRIPLADPLDDALTPGLRWEHEDTNDTTRDTTSVLFHREHNRRQHGYRVGVQWLHENYQAGHDAPRESKMLLLPELSWRWTSAPDPAWVARGYSLAGRVTGALKGFLSDETLAQASGEAKVVWPLGRRGRLLARANLGITSINDVDALPVSLRFFAGGSLSVRGYNYQALAPRDANGDVVGGRHLFTASLEYEHRLRDNLFAAAFFDVGNAFNGSAPDLKRGAGFGVRYALPFGMARLDLATALDRDGHPWRVHFSIGPDL